MTLQERLFSLYDELFDSLVTGTRFAAESEFADLLRRLLDPGLEPYLRALGPRFFERFLGPGPSAAEQAMSGPSDGHIRGNSAAGSDG